MWTRTHLQLEEVNAQMWMYRGTVSSSIDVMTTGNRRYQYTSFTVPRKTHLDGTGFIDGSADGLSHKRTSRTQLVERHHPNATGCVCVWDGSPQNMFSRACTRAHQRARTQRSMDGIRGVFLAKQKLSHGTNSYRGRRLGRTVIQQE